MTSLAAVVNVVGIGVKRAIRTPESAMLPLFCLTAHALHPFVCAITYGNHIYRHQKGGKGFAEEESVDEGEGSRKKAKTAE